MLNLIIHMYSVPEKNTSSWVMECYLKTIMSKCFNMQSKINWKLLLGSYALFCDNMPLLNSR